MDGAFSLPRLVFPLSGLVFALPGLVLLPWRCFLLPRGFDFLFLSFCLSLPAPDAVGVGKNYIWEIGGFRFLFFSWEASSILRFSLSPRAQAEAWVSGGRCVFGKKNAVHTQI